MLHSQSRTLCVRARRYLIDEAMALRVFQFRQRNIVSIRSHMDRTEFFVCELAGLLTDHREVCSLLISLEALELRRGRRSFTIRLAGVAELADALDSKSSDRKIVWVRAPPPAVVCVGIVPSLNI